MTDIHIRRALPPDGQAISQLKNAIWSHEKTDGDYCTRVIAEPDHITHIALIDDRIVGFVDGFLTYAPDGLRRWEVDLLAVGESIRNKGIARQLIQNNLTSALDTWQINYARSLIQVNNIASQRAFEKCQFIMPDSEYRELYVASPDNAETTLKVDERAFLIPVTTLSYQGIWLEGTITQDSLKAARAILSKHQLTTAGLLIHFADTALLDDAKQAGYTFVDRYNYWYRYF